MDSSLSCSLSTRFSTHIAMDSQRTGVSVYAGRPVKGISLTLRQGSACLSCSTVIPGYSSSPRQKVRILSSLIMVCPQKHPRAVASLGSAARSLPPKPTHSRATRPSPDPSPRIVLVFKLSDPVAPSSLALCLASQLLSVTTGVSVPFPPPPVPGLAAALMRARTVPPSTHISRYKGLGSKT